ncbi:MAG: diadenylate cyclase [Planctomycetes bacterium]|nr:diadenylate cyclase [Planctomycetota bacterium]
MPVDQTAKWILQVAILATGIYVFLRFLRTTRGGGLIRGLVFAFIFGAVGLIGLAESLELQELLHIIEGFTPYLAVILVILFHPELRRAMARLGQQNRFAKLFSKRGKGTLGEVAQAAIAMAARRHGALIAFQRETPLDAWTANAARIDAEVSKLLLESIFHPGSALHDGAVVIDGERVVAAACLFPLTENIEISKSTGTRHRAALGLTEESDAVALCVSEETGAISICAAGRMERDIPAAELEARMRAHLGLPELNEEGQVTHLAKSRGSSIVSWIVALFTQDLVRKLAAIALAGVLLYRAHGDIVLDTTLPVQVRERAPGRGAEPSPGFVDVIMPDENHHLVSATRTMKLHVSGTRDDIEKLGGSLGGVVRLQGTLPAGPFDLSTNDVSWSSGAGNLKLRWEDDRPPRLELQAYGSLTHALSPADVEVDLSGRDHHYEARVDELSFEPTSVELRGPRDALAEVEAGTLPFRLEPLRVTAKDTSAKRVQLRLHPSLAERGISLADVETVSVVLPIEPTTYQLPNVERDVVVRNLDANSDVDPEAWTLQQSDQRRQFKVRATGLFDTQPDSEAFKQQRSALLRHIEENLRVFADVSELEENGKSVPLRWMLTDDWRKKVFGADDVPGVLEIEPVGEPRVILKEKP